MLQDGAMMTIFCPRIRQDGLDEDSCGHQDLKISAKSYAYVLCMYVHVYVYVYPTALWTTAATALGIVRIMG